MLKMDEIGDHINFIPVVTIILDDYKNRDIDIAINSTFRYAIHLKVITETLSNSLFSSFRNDYSPAMVSRQIH